MSSDYSFEVSTMERQSKKLLQKVLLRSQYS